MDEKFENLPSGLNPVSKKQPQIAQLEIQFAAPLQTDAMVQSITDLINLPLKYMYQHKQVWVKDRRSHYYLANGDGSLPENWKQVRARTVIEVWDERENYEEGDTIYWSKKIYRARKYVAKGQFNPAEPESEELWECICGDTETLRLIFGTREPASSVIVHTEIVNPYFQVVIGEFEYDSEGQPLLDPITRLVIIKNMQIVEGHVIRREDLDDESGQAYEIQFESDCEAYGLKGAINVK